MVHGQLLAESKLEFGSPVAGQAFFVGNGPMQYLEFWTRLTKTLGGSESDIKVLPRALSNVLALISESITKFTYAGAQSDSIYCL
jgi:hypothetical protein